MGNPVRKKATSFTKKNRLPHHTPSHWAEPRATSNWTELGQTVRGGDRTKGWNEQKKDFLDLGVVLVLKTVHSANFFKDKNKQHPDKSLKQPKLSGGKKQKFHRWGDETLYAMIQLGFGSGKGWDGIWFKYKPGKKLGNIPKKINCKKDKIEGGKTSTLSINESPFEPKKDAVGQKPISLCPQFLIQSWGQGPWIISQWA